VNRVLFIAYYFPPTNGSGVYRSVKFVKYLPSFGWHPYVITTDRIPHHALDHTLLADIPPKARVLRLPTPRPQPLKRLTRWVGWKRKRPEIASHPTAAHDPPPAQSRPSLAKGMRRAALAPLSLIERPPVDEQLYWSLRIVPVARRIIEREKIDVIFTTAAPWSALLSGSLLQRLTGRPWVADFRDPWTDNTLVYSPTGTRRCLDQWLERRLLGRADAVVTVTPPLLESLRAKSPTGRGGRPFVLIPNGWDSDDFPDNGTPPPADEHSVTLFHPGSAYHGEPVALLRALEQFSTEGAILDRLSFRFIGYMHPEDRAQLASSPLSKRFVLEVDRIPHLDVLRLMREAQVLLLLSATPYASPGKVFEYMAAGRPVLAVATGISAELVQCSGVGCVVDPHDHAALAARLRAIAVDYEGFVQEFYHPNWEVINHYERSTLTCRLARLFDGLTLAVHGE
jgi:glycosyltransferase involved in cell wall biosynthesis